ncbi:hypothetical protein [Streptomyces sp. NPDC051992]
MMLRRYHPAPEPDGDPTGDAEQPETDTAPQPKAAGRPSSRTKAKEG